MSYWPRCNTEAPQDNLENSATSLSRMSRPGPDDDLLNPVGGLCYSVPQDICPTPRIAASYQVDENDNAPSSPRSILNDEYELATGNFAIPARPC